MNNVNKFQNSINIEISRCREQIRRKNDSIKVAMNSLQRLYLANGPNFLQQFEFVVGGNVYIQGASELLSDLQLLKQNSNLLFVKKDLPNDVKSALERSYSFSRINNQRDLYNVLKPVLRYHNLNDVSPSHEARVYLSSEGINEQDVLKYYPHIKQQCNFVDNPYIMQSLVKYSCLFQLGLPLTTPSGSSSQYSSQNLPQQYVPQGMQAQYATQGMQAQYATQDMQAQYATQGMQAQYATQGMQAQYATQGMQAQYATQGIPAQYATQGIPAQYAAQGIPAQYTTQGIPAQYVIQGTPTQYGGQDSPQDFEGLPKDLFVSVRPQKK